MNDIQAFFYWYSHIVLHILHRVVYKCLKSTFIISALEIIQFTIEYLALKSKCYGIKSHIKGY